MASKQLMQYSEEDLVAILKHFGRTKKDIQADVDIIKNWLQMQPHIPEMPDDEVIKRFLSLSKFSIERTKEKIDNYYTIRNFTKELFSHHPLNPEMLESYKVWHFLMLPKLVNVNRVIVFKLISDDPEKIKPECLYNHVLNVCEVRLMNDFCISNLVVLDLSNIKMSHLLRNSISLLHKFQTVIEKVYSMRIKEVHLINGFEAILNAFKNIFKPKLRKRIFVHKSYDSLYQHIPKDVLPKDLGGEEKSLKELSEILLKCFEEMEERYDVLTRITSNEALRPGKPINDEFFGFYGNFRKIEVD